MLCHSCGSDTHLIAQCPKQRAEPHLWVNPIASISENQEQGLSFYTGDQIALAPPPPEPWRPDEDDSDKGHNQSGR